MHSDTTAIATCHVSTSQIREAHPHVLPGYTEDGYVQMYGNLRRVSLITGWTIINSI